MVASIAIVVPTYRDRLTVDEEISLRHLELVLDGRPRYLVAPRSLGPERAGFEVASFDDDYFQSVDSYSRLLLEPSFYRRFEDYEFVLIYQLDCLVFRDELDRFAAAGFDYVGAPWLETRKRPERGFSRVGNGGLCLRRVEACLRVLETEGPGPRTVSTLLRLARRREPQNWRQRLRVARETAEGVARYRRVYSLNEDHFWCDRAPLFDPQFRVADVATGLAFSFDEAPRFAYSILGGLPMGCHGWHRRERAFWEPYLLPEALDFDAPGVLA